MNKKKRVYKYANGGLLKDSGYVFNSLPQYGLGSWLGENAGTIGSVAGAGLSLIPGVGPLLGAAAGAAGNMIGGNYAASQKEAEQAKLVADQEAQQRFSVGQQNAMSQYQAQSNPMYGAVFAYGGKMKYSDGGAINDSNPVILDSLSVSEPRVQSWSDIPNTIVYNLNGKDVLSTKDQIPVLFKSDWDKLSNSSQDVRDKLIYQKYNIRDRGTTKSPSTGTMKQIVSRAKGEVPKFSNGGNIVEATKGLDNVTVFANGGSHENNIKGGITLGNRAQVEQNEVRFGDYIFSDRLPYKK